MAEVKAAVKTEQELREQRLQIYCKETKGGAPCTPGAIAQALGIANANEVPSLNNRDHNFATFVAQHFVRETNVMEEDFLYSWPEGGAIIHKKAYQTLKDYARTPYGAVIINHILQEHSMPGWERFKKRFKVRLFDGREAAGSTDLIMLPSGFPLKTVLDSGEIVDPWAIIHHEFGHTRYFTRHQPGKLVTLQDERDVVIHMENPARMFNKNEPRYAYYNNDEANPHTINIITGEEKGGIHTTDKADPRILIQAK